MAATATSGWPRRWRGDLLPDSARVRIEVLNAGASGYLLKDGAASELLAGIRALKAGHAFGETADGHAQAAEGDEQFPPSGAGHRHADDRRSSR